MWRIRRRLFLGDYASGEEALGGALYPVEPSEELSPFAGVVSLCPVPLVKGRGPERPMSELTEWLKIPIQDGGNGEAEFESALGVALPFTWRRLQSGNVLIHCAAGMSRSVSVVAALLCAEGAGVDDAFQRIARAKAAAIGPTVLGEEFLIAPASEFRSCLNRLYRPRPRR